MTRGFWRDPDRFVETYWSRFPGVWTHGDWASVDEDGFWFLHGRSDDTLNIAGKRIGPAELESAAVAHAGGLGGGGGRRAAQSKGQGRIQVFCILRPGEPSDVSRRAVRDGRRRARQGIRPRPDHFVDALPKTRSAKIVRARSG